MKFHQPYHSKVHENKPVGRVGDLWTGVCVCHPIPIPMSGVIITGSDNVITNNRRTARLYDLTIGFCGHCGIIITGSRTTFVNQRNCAGLTDQVTGCNVGQIVSGSPNVWNDYCSKPGGQI